MTRKLPYLLVLFLVLDVAFSFIQHLHLPHDGDMAAIIMPAEWYRQVLNDPFGISAVTTGEKYGGPNRFFAHWSLSAYFKTVPLWLQQWVSPIQSTYLAAAIGKILIQIGLIYLLAAYISGALRLSGYSWLLAAALVTPLFQTSGFYNYIGIIDQSTTYTFFYALPAAVLLAFFLPFYRAYVLNKPFTRNLPVHLFLLAGVVVIPFHGPLSAAVIMVVCPGALLYFFLRNYNRQPGLGMISRVITAIQQIPRPVLVYFTLIVLVSVYSFYVGTFNNENTLVPLALYKRYLLLPQGLFYIFFKKLSFPLLLVFIGLNIWLIRKYSGGKGNRLLWLFLWIGLFCAVYTLLLPLGGYRVYRPYIVRRDTFLPVTLAVCFVFGLSSYFILSETTFKQKNHYIAGLIGFLFIFSFTDRKWLNPNYVKEKEALEQIAAAAQNPVRLTINSPVLAWQTYTHPAQSEYAAQLLKRWNITTEKKRYYYSE